MKIRLLLMICFYGGVALFAYDFFYSKKDIQEAKTEVDELRRIPYYNANAYQPDFQKPLSERILKAPEFMLKHIGDLDRRQYKAYLPTKKESDTIRGYLKLLPPLYKKVLEEHLIGIYFVEENFLGSGYADICYDDDYRLKTFLLINKNTLDLTLEEWVNKKESSCFTPGRESPYKVHVETTEDHLGVLAILLHETSHCVDYIKRFTPDVYSKSKMYNVINNNPVLAEGFSSTWKSDLEFSKDAPEFPLRSKITFYSMNDGPKLELSQAQEVYRQLSKSPFVSLYSTLRRCEDFAEAAMYYHMTQYLKFPYELQVYKQDKVIFSYEPMKNPKILKRLEFLKKHLY